MRPYMEDVNYGKVLVPVFLYECQAEQQCLLLKECIDIVNGLGNQWDTAISSYKLCQKDKDMHSGVSLCKKRPLNQIILTFAKKQII